MLGNSRCIQVSDPVAQAADNSLMGRHRFSHLRHLARLLMSVTWGMQSHGGHTAPEPHT